MNCTVYFMKESSYEDLYTILHDATMNMDSKEKSSIQNGLLYEFTCEYLHASLQLLDKGYIIQSVKEVCEEISAHYNIKINCCDLSIHGNNGNDKGIAVFLKFSGELLRRIPGDMAILLDTDIYALVLRRNGEILVNEFGSDIFDYDYSLLGLPYMQFSDQDK